MASMNIIFFLYGLDLYVPFGVIERMLESIAAYGGRQSTPLNEFPAHCRAQCEL